MSHLPPFLKIGNAGEILADDLQRLKFSRLVCICDSQTKQHCLPLIREALPEHSLILEMETGEKHKELDTCEKIWRQMVEADIDRQSLILNLGGGVVTDMGAFSAAVFKRGVPFIQIPTSLLAMADASLGDKTGVNFGGAKNMLGTFSRPQSVIIDSGFLNTLDNRNLWNGYAEMLKHSLLIGKEAFYTFLSTNSLERIAPLIHDSLAFKWKVVENDPLETENRKILNIGHTVGHALESLSDGKLMHGEAILHGLSIELMLSEELLGLSSDFRSRLDHFIADHYPPFPENIDSNEAIHLMSKDKKNRGKQIRFCLVKSPGEVKLDIEVDPDLLIRKLRSYGFS